VGELINEALDEYKSWTSNIVIIHKLAKNLGLGLALREGALLCSGDYIFRLDSDDISIPSRVGTCLSYMDKNLGVSALGGSIKEFNFTVGDRSQLRKVPLDTKSIQRFSKLRNPMNHVTVCFRKSFFETVNYEHMPLYEDYFLWMNAIAKNIIIENLDEVFVHVRVADGIGSRRSGLNYLLNDFNFAKAVYKRGYFGYIAFCKYLFLRIIVRLMPSKMITKFYKVFLRSR